jgi:hypothetical protein
LRNASSTEAFSAREVIKWRVAMMAVGGWVAALNEKWQNAN